MKKITFILFALITGTTFAQNTSSDAADVNVEIVQPIAISATNGMNFGQIAPMSDASGTVTLSTEGGRTDDKAGEMLIGNEGFNAAKFEITAADQTYNFVIPEEVTLTNENSKTMKLVPLTDLDGTQSSNDGILNVGGELSVGENQDPGNYEGKVEITVTYE